MINWGRIAVALAIGGRERRLMSAQAIGMRRRLFGFPVERWEREANRQNECDRVKDTDEQRDSYSL
jgi:hypothetical protein